MNSSSSYYLVAKYISGKPLLTTLSILSSLLGVFFELLCFSMLSVLVQGAGDLNQLQSLPGHQFLNFLFHERSLAERVNIIALVLAISAVFRGLCLTGSAVFSQIIEQNILYSLRTSVFSKALNLDFQKFHQRTHGNTQTQVQTYTVETSLAVSSALRFLQAFILMLVYTCCLMFISPKLTLGAAMILGSIYLVTKKRLTGSLKKLAERYTTIVSLINTLSVESLSGIRAIKLFSKENFCYNQFEELARKCRKTNLIHYSTAYSINPAISTAVLLTISALLSGGIFIFGAKFEYHLPSIIVFIVILTRLAPPFHLLSFEYAAFLRYAPSVTILSKFLNQNKDSYYEVKTPSSPLELKKEIRFENIDFKYLNTDKRTISNLNFSIKKSSMVAFVGPSGSGKSTIVNLLGKLLLPTSGRILVDETDLSKIHNSEWRKHIAFVSQDNFLFNDTITNNLRFANSEASMNEIIKAAKTANAHEFIENLEKGYETVVGNNGVRLSGGQQQRISIARAILANPDILVLDEATSNLDSFSEQAIQDAIRTFQGKCTLIVVAHRLSTIQTADEILVLKNGMIIEQGNHQELQALGGTYNSMIAIQSTSSQLLSTVK